MRVHESRRRTDAEVGLLRTGRHDEDIAPPTPPHRHPAKMLAELRFHFTAVLAAQTIIRPHRAAVDLERGEHHADTVEPMFTRPCGRNRVPTSARARSA